MEKSVEQIAAGQYEQLSVKDLLEARELYHVHLMQHPNVVATAIGRYRIRKVDSWPSRSGPGKKHGRGRRTLENSEVRPYSWPALLVFVSDWAEAHEFGPDGRYDPDQMVPPALFLPDGRRVPVCIIEAPRTDRRPIEAPDVRFPTNNIGGGFPVIADVQGKQHVATVGCLVSDGHRYYGLTNRHVTGDTDEVIFSELDGKTVAIGRSSVKQLTRMPFPDVYPGWAGRHVYVNLDVGLIDIDDINKWTAQIRGIGTMGPLVNLSVDNMTLALIGSRVAGFGSAGNMMQGEIHALFYRYKAQAGFDYVADFFIGPRTTSPKKSNKKVPRFATLPGDSGTLWLLAPAPKAKGKNHTTPEHRPLAVQWGENILGSEGACRQPYVLATCLSTVCNLLAIDPVRDWNLDTPDTWGAVGHFSIAARSANALSERVPRLKKLMTNNLEIISHDDQTILSSEFKNMGTDEFVPLADVPDFFWKHGKQGASRGLEGPNHFADMDQKRPVDAADLLKLCEDDANINPDVWNQFYGSVADLLSGEEISQKHRGLLPFRVWQIFEGMVEFVRKGKKDEFVCAAGVLTHYIGDACQPLHISYLHDGDPERATTRTVHHRDGTSERVKDPLGKGVHAAYEDEMINTHRQQILDGLSGVSKVKKGDLINTGFEAAKLTIALMRDTFSSIPPVDIVGAFLATQAEPKKRPAVFWKKFGKTTVDNMREGAELVARLWESAWVLGEGERTINSGAALDRKKAMRICADRDFLPSCSIEEIGALLGHPNAPAPQRTQAKRRTAAVSKRKPTVRKRPSAKKRRH